MIANIAETESVDILKTYKIWVLLKKIDGFFGENLIFFSNSLKVAKLP